MGLQCGLSRPHLTKHSDDAEATKMAGGSAISLRNWACRVESFWWMCTWTSLQYDEHWDLLHFALVCSKDAYHARYHTCNSKMSVIYRFQQCMPRQLMSQTMFSMNTMQSQVITTWFQCTALRWCMLHVGPSPTQPANPWLTPEPPLADHVYGATFKGFQNISLKHMW